MIAFVLPDSSPTTGTDVAETKNAPEPSGLGIMTLAEPLAGTRGNGLDQVGYKAVPLMDWGICTHNFTINSEVGIRSKGKYIYGFTSPLDSLCIWSFPFSLFAE